MLSKLSTMPPVGLVVIVVILSLFILSLIVLFITYARYSRLARLVGNLDRESDFLRYTVNSFADAYKRHGRDVNTPAIIADAVRTRMGGSLLCERYLNNAVSLFVTLGLFGTFLGLSMSVSSLTELISLSNTSEWLSVLDSVGGGLMSALSGMGVAFYTSLVGAGCSILLTILRTILSPQAAREKLETRLELWLDTEIAPTLTTEAVKDDAELLGRLIETLNASAGEFRSAMRASAEAYAKSTQASAAAITRATQEQKEHLRSFDESLEKFNSGVHDFSEVDYNLRGSVERMDLAVRDLASAFREISRRMGGGRQQ